VLASLLPEWYLSDNYFRKILIGNVSILSFEPFVVSRGLRDKFVDRLLCSPADFLVNKYGSKSYVVLGSGGGDAVKRLRLAALFAVLKRRMGDVNDTELSRRTGVSRSAVQRISSSQNASLVGDNRKNLCQFLHVEPAEFDSYLVGEISLEILVRNVSLLSTQLVASSDLQEQSRIAKIQLLENLLPKIQFDDFVEIWREMQIRYLAWSADYRYVPNIIASPAVKVADFLAGLDFDEISEQTDISVDRLRVIAAQPNSNSYPPDSMPTDHEVCLLGAALGIPAEVILEVRDREFGRSHQQEFSEREDLSTNGV
jgi:transcriptional regulator with XRE-family HTH domain